MVLRARTWLFFGICLGSVLVNMTFFRQLLSFSLKNDFSSHILLIPFVSAALILRERAAIFSRVGHSVLVGAGILAFAVALRVFVDALSVKTAAIVLMWIGAFVLSFGMESFRRALFPLLFLVFMIPIPETLLRIIVSTLQRGSADATEILFKLTGTPFFREGLTFQLPRISIEIASLCSGIRSSLALLITCLLAAHLYLNTFWRKSLFALLAVPMAMVKNAIRITTLSLLSIHVDTRFIVSSDLHHEGGILFFLLALALMMPILWVLRRSELNSKTLRLEDSKK
jgi:exosortase